MRNAPSSRRTTFQSQMREIRQNSCSFTFASAVIAVGFITLSSGNSCGKRSFDSCSSWQRSSATGIGGCGGGLETCPTFRTCRCRPDSSTRHTPTRRMECESRTHSRGFAPRQGGDFLGERERGEGVDGGDALQRVLDSARLVEVQKSRCWYKTRMYAERAALPASAGGGRGAFPCSTRAQHHKRKRERWWNEANRSEPEQTVHRETGLGSSRTGPASRSETTVATQSWCGSARRASSDAHCWSRRIASCGPDGKLELRRCTAGQWNGRRDDPAILHDRGGKNPLPLCSQRTTTSFWESCGTCLSHRFLGAPML